MMKRGRRRGRIGQTAVVFRDLMSHLHGAVSRVGAATSDNVGDADGEHQSGEGAGDHNRHQKALFHVGGAGLGLGERGRVRNRVGVPNRHLHPQSGHCHSSDHSTIFIGDVGNVCGKAGDAGVRRTAVNRLGLQVNRRPFNTALVHVNAVDSPRGDVLNSVGCGCRRKIKLQIKCAASQKKTSGF